MFLFKKDDWEFWPDCHPDNLGCVHEGREICDCKYHIVNEKHTEILSFNDYKTAFKKFQELTGMEEFIVGKSKYVEGEIKSI